MHPNARPDLRRSRPLLALLALGLLAASPHTAWAVVVTSGNGNTTAASLLAAGGPGDPNLPGFNNVGRGSTGNSSVTYLGNGWVLTANHVTIDNSAGPVRFGANNYTVDMGSITQLVNPDNTLADLKLFRLTSDPGLPSILPSMIASATPSGRVIMIGNGRSLGDARFWNVNTGTTPWTWNSVPSGGNAAGFDVINPRVIRWGENNVHATNQNVQVGPNVWVQGFTTRFDHPFYSGGTALTHEAQATVGDSGGAVFSFVGGQWQLSGIMIAVNDPYSGQPANTVIYSDQTLIADLSIYRNQILAIVPEPSSLALAALALVGLGLFGRRRGR